MRRLLTRFLLAHLLIAVLFCSALQGQSSGRFSGQVTDQDGGAIPEATVQIVNQETLVKREVKTDGAGAYAVPSLPPGRYQIIVEADGFSRRSSDVIPLSLGQSLTFNAAMSVGGATVEVEVNGAGSSGVETTTATISTTMEQKEVTGYGLNGRNFSQLISIAPGVSNQTGQDEAKVGVAGSAKYSVNGGRVEYNTFEVDGSDVLNTSINASRGQGEPLMVYPSIDAIQDVKVITSNYSALYGKSASGSVLVTTRSGTEKFHGNAYGFLRNEAFNARNYFDQPDPVPLGYRGKPHYRTPLYRRLDFGATIGGPVFIPNHYNTGKSKTYFFFSEEIRREKTPVAYNQAVPTMAERAGDFTDLCPTPIPGAPITYNQAQYPDCPDASGTFGANVFANSANVDYTAAALLNSGIIPAPNSSTGCNSTSPSPLPHCYVASVSPATHWREELFRIDHNLSASERLSFRYVHDSWDTVTLAPQWGVVHNSFPTVENFLNGPGLDVVVSLAQILPHEFINRLAFSYAVEHISLTPQPGVGVTSITRPAILDGPGPSGSSTPCTTDTNINTQCPFGYIFNNGFGGNKLPGLVFQGNNGAYGGHGFAADTGYAPWTQSNPTFDLRDDAAKTIGHHTVQFGFEGTYVQQNEQSAVSGANSGDLQGLLTFSNQQSIYTTGNAFYDFLAGPAASQGLAVRQTAGGIKSYTQDSGQARYYNRYKIADLYLQDDWLVSSRLTVNLGFRASLFGGWFNSKNTAYNWRPETFDPSLGRSFFIDPLNGFLVRNGTGLPVPLNSNHLDPVISNGLTQCGANGVPSACMKNSLFHPAPRVGISWDPRGDGKTAIRAGYGLFWEHGTGYEANSGSLIGSAPLILSETQSNIYTGTNGAFSKVGLSCQDGASQCGTYLLPSTPAGVGAATFPLNVTSIPTKAVYTYVQQWSLSVQREINKNLVGQLAYVGSKATHLTAVRDLNQIQPLSDSQNPFKPGQPITAGVCAGGAQYKYFTADGINGQNNNIASSAGIGPETPGYTNAFIACTGNPGFRNSNRTTSQQNLGLSPDSVRPYPGFSNVISVSNIADSKYNALQGTLRQTVGALTVGLAYTYSHSQDDSSDRSSANFANSLDIHSNRASSDFDQRHILNVNYIYDLPLVNLLQGFARIVGSGDDSPDSSPWIAGSSVKAALGGWQISGITTFQSGTPFSVINGGGSDGTSSQDNAGVGDALGIGSYADISGDAKTGKPFVAPGGNNVGPLLLNPGAFTAPRGLTFGNSGRNYLRNPTRTNFNVSLFKHFKPFTERLDLEFRAEAFNVFNHTQFRITDPSNPGNTGNNVINCYGSQVDRYSAGASSCLNGNSFLHPVDAHDPRILQFAIKGQF